MGLYSFFKQLYWIQFTYHAIHSYKVYNLIAFSIFTTVNLSSQSNVETFHYHRKKLSTHESEARPSLSTTASPSPTQLTYFPFLWVCLSWILAIRNNASMNTYIQDFVWAYIFISLGYIPRIGITGLMIDDSRFKYLGNCQTVFKSCLSILHSHQQCMRVIISLQPHQQVTCCHLSFCL